MGPQCRLLSWKGGIPSSPALAFKLTWLLNPLADQGLEQGDLLVPLGDIEIPVPKHRPDRSSMATG